MKKKTPEELKAIFKYRDLLIKHDVRKFGKFLRRNITKIPELPKEILNYTDSQLSEFMHYVKASYPYLGQHFQESRNYFRQKELQEGVESADYLNDDLDQYLKQTNGVPPKCYQCQHFRTPINEKGPACIHLSVNGRRPALPEDMACTAWTPMPDTVKTS